MPATPIIDLDLLAPPPKQVRIGGEVYTLPGDIPVELYLRINQFNADGAKVTDLEVIQYLHDELLKLFHVHHPGLDELPMSIAQAVLAVGVIYGGAGQEDQDGPPPRAKAGTPSSRRSRSRSRS